MKVVGKYQLIAEIKRGEHGATYRGWDTQQQHLVLIKTFKPLSVTLQEQGCTARFAQEAEAYTRIDHSNIVKLWDYGYEAGVCYLALEFVEGQDLRRVLQQSPQQGALPSEIAVAILYEALQGLAEIHRQNVIHRDLKPENILISHTGQVKLCDFDLATQDEEATSGTGWTGSPGYVAPEVILGEKVTCVADLFSLAVVFYEMLTGVRPFQAASPGGEMNAIVRLAHLPLSKVRHEAPARLEELLDHMLAKNADARIATATAVRQWLDDHFELGTTATRTQLIHRYLTAPREYQATGCVERTRVVHAPSTRTTRWRWAYAVSFAGILLVSMGWFYWQAQRAKPASMPASALSSLPKVSVDSLSSKRELEQARQVVEPKTTAVSLLDSHESSRAVPESLNVSAVPRARTILIRSNPWAYLFLNGDSLGMTPLAVTLPASANPQPLIFKNPQFPQVEVALRLEAQTTDTFSLSLWEQIAQLELQITPWAEVYINNEKRALAEGEKSLLLLPGKYHLRFVHTQLGEKTETISLRAGEVRHLAINMF